MTQNQLAFDCDKSLLPGEAAEELRIAEPTLRRWLREGRVHGVRLGNRWRIPASEIRRLLEPTLLPAE